MTRRPETLDELRVGDEVAWVSGCHYREKIEIARVDAASKRYVLVRGQRFRRDGREVGANRHYAPHLLACIEPLNERNIQAANVCYLREFEDWADLTHDQIDRIRAVLDGSEG